jgi:quinol monooxygenase YgiN
MLRGSPVAILIVLTSAIPVHAQLLDNGSRYAVSYVELVPTAREALIAAFRQYRDASRGEPGYVTSELLEQTGRRGRFVILETWQDQAAFDAHAGAAAVKRFQDALQPVRVSGYDQRPYKALAVAPPRTTSNGQAVHVVSHVDIAGQAVDAPGLLRRLAEASRLERGAVRVDVLQHVMRPNHFTVVETWRDERALELHAAAAHTRQYRDALQPVSGSPLDERTYKAIQ